MEFIVDYRLPAYRWGDQIFIQHPNGWMKVTPSICIKYRVVGELVCLDRRPATFGENWFNSYPCERVTLTPKGSSWASSFSFFERVS